MGIHEMILRNWLLWNQVNMCYIWYQTVVAHAFSPSTWETKTGETPTWCTEQVPVPKPVSKNRESGSYSGHPYIQSPKLVNKKATTFKTYSKSKQKAHLKLKKQDLASRWVFGAYFTASPTHRGDHGHLCRISHQLDRCCLLGRPDHQT